MQSYTIEMDLPDAALGPSDVGCLSARFSENGLWGRGRQARTASMMLTLASPTFPTMSSSSTADYSSTEGCSSSSDYTGGSATSEAPVYTSGERARARPRASFEQNNPHTGDQQDPVEAADSQKIEKGEMTMVPDGRSSRQTAGQQSRLKKLEQEAVDKATAREEARLSGATSSSSAATLLDQTSFFCLPPAALSSGDVRGSADVQDSRENEAPVSGRGRSPCGSTLSPTRASSPGGTCEGLTVSTSSSLTEDSPAPCVLGLFSKPVHSAFAAAAAGTDASSGYKPAAAVDAPLAQRVQSYREPDLCQEHLPPSFTSGSAERGRCQAAGETADGECRSRPMCGVSHRRTPASARASRPTTGASPSVGLSLSSEETLLALSIPVSSTSHLCGSEPCVGPQPESVASVSPLVPHTAGSETPLNGLPESAPNTEVHPCATSGFDTATSLVGTDAVDQDALPSGDVSVRRSSSDSDPADLPSEGPAPAPDFGSHDAEPEEATCSPSCGGPWGCFSCMRRALASEIDVDAPPLVQTKFRDVYERLCVAVGLTLHHQKTLQQLVSSLAVVHRHQEQRRKAEGDSTLRQDAITLACARQLLSQMQQEYWHAIDVAAPVSCEHTAFCEHQDCLSGHDSPDNRANGFSRAEAGSGTSTQGISARDKGRQTSIQRVVGARSGAEARRLTSLRGVTSGPTTRGSDNNATGAALQELRVALARLSEAGQLSRATGGVPSGPNCSSMPSGGSSSFWRHNTSSQGRNSTETSPEVLLLQALREDQRQKRRLTPGATRDRPRPCRVLGEITGVACPDTEDAPPDGLGSRDDFGRSDSNRPFSSKIAASAQVNAAERPRTRGWSSGAVAHDESNPRKRACEDGRGFAVSQTDSGELVKAGNSLDHEGSGRWPRVSGGQWIDDSMEGIAQQGAAEGCGVKGRRCPTGATLIGGGEPSSSELVEGFPSGARRAGGRRASDPGSGQSSSALAGPQNSAIPGLSTSVYCRGSNVRHQEDPYPHNVMIQLIQPLPTGIKLELKSNRSGTSGASAAASLQEEDQQQSAPREYALRVSLTRHETKYCSFHASHGILPAYNDAVRMRNKHAGLPFSLPLMTLEDLQARKELLDRGEVLPNHGPDEAFMTVQERITYYKQLAAAEAAVARVTGVPEPATCAPVLSPSLQNPASLQQPSSSFGRRTTVYGFSENAAASRLRSRSRSFREARAALRRTGSGANGSTSGTDSDRHFHVKTGCGQPRAFTLPAAHESAGLQGNSGRAGSEQRGVWGRRGVRHCMDPAPKAAAAADKESVRGSADTAVLGPGPPHDGASGRVTPARDTAEECGAPMWSLEEDP